MSRMLRSDADYKSVWLHVVAKAKIDRVALAQFKSTMYEWYNTVTVAPTTAKGTSSADKVETFTDQEIALVTTLIDTSLKKRTDEATAKKKVEAAKKAAAKTEAEKDPEAGAKQLQSHEVWLQGQRCHGCGQLGHLVKECPAKENSVTTAAASAASAQNEETMLTVEQYAYLDSVIEDADPSEWCCDPSESMAADPFENPMSMAASLEMVRPASASGVTGECVHSCLSMVHSVNESESRTASIFSTPRDFDYSDVEDELIDEFDSASDSTDLADTVMPVGQHDTNQTYPGVMGNLVQIQRTGQSDCV